VRYGYDTGRVLAFFIDGKLRIYDWIAWQGAATAMTFKECAERYIDAHKAGWRNSKHAARWPSTLATYAYPVFGDLPVQAVDVRLVTKALEPIWRMKPETANRVRGRIESVLDPATVRGYRKGDNPARWRGHLDKLLPARAKVRKVEHHAALPYVAVARTKPDFNAFSHLDKFAHSQTYGNLSSASIHSRLPRLRPRTEPRNVE
jgi:hypothetical protein